MSHTPAPWIATEYGVRDAGGYICQMTWPCRYGDQVERYTHELAQRKADARLIASSPLLLEALQRIADMSDRDGNLIEMHREELRGIARAAIAAATGEQQ